MIILKTILALFLMVSLVNCENFSYGDFDKDPADRTRKTISDSSDDSGLSFDFDDIDHQVFKDTIKDLEKCTGYKSNTPFINLTGGLFGGAPEKIKQCIDRALDNALEPMCIQKAEAEEAIEEYRKEDSLESERSIERLEEYIYSLEDIEYEAVDFLYDMADIVFEVSDDLLDEVDEYKDRHNNNPVTTILGAIGRFVVKDNIETFGNYFEDKAKVICSGNLQELIDRAKKKNQFKRD